MPSIVEPRGPEAVREIRLIGGRSYVFDTGSMIYAANDHGDATSFLRTGSKPGARPAPRRRQPPAECLIVNSTSNTYHRNDCRWLAGAHLDPENLVEAPLDAMPEDAARCSYCAPI